MKSSTFKTAVLVFGMMVISNMSFGQSQKGEKKGPPTFSQLIEEMDENEDGKLAKAELKGPLQEDFAKVDTDEDGFITEEEFNKAPKPKRKARNK